MTNALTLVNAPRRDVVMLPGSGYVMIAMKTNNPGAWLIHCHIAWHTSEGFAVQLLERASEITINQKRLNSICAKLQRYVYANDATQYGSGV